MQLSRVVIDAERAGASQLISAVTSTQQADRKHTGPARGQLIPDRITYYKAFVDGHAQSLLAVKEQVGSRFGPLDVAAFDHQGLSAHAQSV